MKLYINFLFYKLGQLEKIHLKRRQSLVQAKNSPTTMKILNDIIHINEANFEQVTQKFSIPVFVDYWTD